jgi:hypothetical protein
MHPDTDPALNSRVYQQQVLQRLTFGLPGKDASLTCRGKVMQTVTGWHLSVIVMGNRAQSLSAIVRSHLQ